MVFMWMLKQPRCVSFQIRFLFFRECEGPLSESGVLVSESVASYFSNDFFFSGETSEIRFQGLPAQPTFFHIQVFRFSRSSHPMFKLPNLVLSVNISTRVRLGYIYVNMG